MVHDAVSAVNAKLARIRGDHCLWIEYEYSLFLQPSTTISLNAKREAESIDLILLACGIDPVGLTISNQQPFRASPSLTLGDRESETTTKQVLHAQESSQSMRAEISLEPGLGSGPRYLLLSFNLFQMKS